MFNEIRISANREECLIYPAMLGLFSVELPKGQPKPKVSVHLNCETRADGKLSVEVNVRMSTYSPLEPEVHFDGAIADELGEDLSSFELLLYLGGLVSRASEIAAQKYRIEKDDDEVVRVLTNPHSVPTDVLFAAISAAGERKIEKVKARLFEILDNPSIKLAEVVGWALLRYEDEEVIKSIGRMVMSADSVDFPWLEFLCLAKAVEQDKVSDAATKALMIISEQHHMKHVREMASGLRHECSKEDLASKENLSLWEAVVDRVDRVRMELFRDSLRYIWQHLRSPGGFTTKPPPPEHKKNKKRDREVPRKGR